MLHKLSTAQLRDRLALAQSAVMNAASPADQLAAGSLCSAIAAELRVRGAL